MHYDVAVKLLEEASDMDDADDDDDDDDDGCSVDTEGKAGSPYQQLPAVTFETRWRVAMVSPLL